MGAVNTLQAELVVRADARRENCISALGESVEAAYSAGLRDLARRLAHEMACLIAGRSAQQVARMEAARGLISATRGA